MTSIVKTSPVASEGGHWYDRHGNLVETVTKAKGGAKAPTLREARKLDLAPGVTTIIRSAAAPGLETWKRNQSILAALTLTRQPEETDAAYLARVAADADAQAKVAREEGTRIHAALELAYSGKPFDDAYKQHVEAVSALVADITGYDERWLPEKGVASVWGYGTKVDLHSEKWVLDFKGTDGDQARLDKLKIYDEHKMQLAAGREALAPRSEEWKPGQVQSSARCAIVYVSRTHPGAVAAIEVTQQELAQGRCMFAYLLQFWQSKNNWRPSWAREVQL